MPYILIVIFIATAPGRIDHIDSIRFDNQKACQIFESSIDFLRKSYGSVSADPKASPDNIRTVCVAASLG